MNKLVRTYFMVIVLMTCIFQKSFAGPAQPRKFGDLSTSENTGYSKGSIDSAIQEVATAISRIVNSSRISKEDSLQLKELGSRLAFLTQLSLKLNPHSSNVTSIQQDRLSIAILCFGFLIIATLLFFQLRERQGINYMTFKLLGIIFIGTVSVFLIPAGFDNNQITPVVGLLGTLAGYLIGTSRSTTQESSAATEKSG